MPTLAVHSFGNEHFEAFYRPDSSSAGWFRSYGTLERVAYEISALVGLGKTDPGKIEFDDRYGESSDRRDFDKIVSATKTANAAETSK